MEPRIGRPKRSKFMETMARYILGIIVLALFFTISHILLWKPNDNTQTAEDMQIQEVQEDVYDY